MGETIALEDNWRSSAVIVNFNNQFFEALRNELDEEFKSFYNSVYQHPKSPKEGYIEIISKEIGEETNEIAQLIEWIEAWNEFVVLMKEKLGDKNLPGFPIWADDWVLEKDLRIPRGTPEWKENFLRKNSEFYTEHKTVLNKWLKKWNNLESFPPSRRMFEWQAQDSKTLWETIMHFRPSGIRAKRATYVPALVAITQTSIIGKQKRRITVREGARLQGLPDWFDFVDQPDKVSYKQLGNGVNIGAVYNVLKAQVIRDLDLLGDIPKITRSILGAPANPDSVLESHKAFHSYKPNTEPVDLNEFTQLRLIK
jgi:DNA (cytosine-5)-methyltransferase 1